MNKEVFFGLLIAFGISITATSVLAGMHITPPPSVDNMVLVLGGAVATAAVPGATAMARKVGTALRVDDPPGPETPPVQPAPVVAPQPAVTLGQASTVQVLEEALSRLRAGKGDET